MDDEDEDECSGTIDDLLAFGPVGYGVVVDGDGPHVSNFARDGFYVRGDPPESFIGADDIPWVYRFTGPDGKDYYAPLLNSAQMMRMGQALVDGLRAGLQKGGLLDPEDDADALPLGA